MGVPVVSIRWARFAICVATSCVGACATAGSNDVGASDSAVDGGADGLADSGSPYDSTDTGSTCDPKAPAQCDGSGATKKCRPDGSGYDSTPCPAGMTCTDGVCGPAPSCPPGTVFADGQCDDVRCPDELSTAPP